MRDIERLQITHEIVLLAKNLITNKAKLNQIETWAFSFYLQSIGTTLQTLSKEFTSQHPALQKVCFTDSGSWHRNFRLDVCHQTTLEELKNLKAGSSESLRKMGADLDELSQAIEKTGVTSNGTPQFKSKTNDKANSFVVESSLSGNEQLIYTINQLSKTTDAKSSTISAALLLMMQTLGNQIQSLFKNYKYEGLVEADTSWIQFISIRKTIAHLSYGENKPLLSMSKMFSETGKYIQAFRLLFAKEITTIEKKVNASAAVTTAPSQPPHSPLATETIANKPKEAQERPKKRTATKPAEHPKKVADNKEHESEDALLEKAISEAQTMRQASSFIPNTLELYKAELKQFLKLVEENKFAESLQILKANPHLVNLPIKFKLSKTQAKTTKHDEKKSTVRAHEWYVCNNDFLGVDLRILVRKYRASHIFFTPFSFALQKLRSQGYLYEENNKQYDGTIYLEFFTSIITDKELSPNLNTITLGDNGRFEPLLHTFMDLNFPLIFLKTCLECGLDINKVDEDGYSALTYCLILDDDNYFDFLIENGATFQQQTVFSSSLDKLDYSNPFTALAISSKSSPELRNHLFGKVLKVLMADPQNSNQTRIWVMESVRFLYDFQNHPTEPLYRILHSLLTMLFYILDSPFPLFTHPLIAGDLVRLEQCFTGLGNSVLATHFIYPNDNSHINAQNIICANKFFGFYDCASFLEREVSRRQTEMEFERLAAIAI